MKRRKNLAINKYCIEARHTNKKGLKLTLDFLEKLIARSSEAGKEPFLIVAIRRNDKEVIKLKCSISIEREEDMSK